MECLPPDFVLLVEHFAGCVGSTPNAASFTTLVLGWILCRGRRTLSGVIRAAGPFAPKSHDAYQNFFSMSKWDMDVLWEGLFLLLVAALCMAADGTVGPIWIAGDDTLLKHYGHRIWGAGLYRDAVKSSRKRTVFSWGHNWTVLVMIVKVPLLEERFVALPILARLNPKLPGEGKTKSKGKGAKNKQTTVTLMTGMIRMAAGWAPSATFIFCGDGAYACLAGEVPPNVLVVSRIRRDAAIYAPAPRKRKKGQPGPNPRKGKRMRTPQDYANALPEKAWRLHRLCLYGEIVERQIHTFTAVWDSVLPGQPIPIVCVRDPKGEHDDEFFFSTDSAMSPEQIILYYAGRWSIEVVFRECKQYLGIQDPQARKRDAILRLAPFVLWLNALVKCWFLLLPRQEQLRAIDKDPWYPHKNTISFQDMLTALRTHFWCTLISPKSTSTLDFGLILQFIVKSVAKVV